MHNSFILISNINTRSFRFISPSVLNISLSCPGLSYHYHPSKTRSWNLNPASYAICQGSWMMKGQRERYTIGGEEKAIIVWQQEGGKQEEKKVRSLFCFWWGSWVSSVNPLNTHTDVSRIPRHHRPNTRVWFGKKDCFNFSKNQSWRWVNGRYDKYVTHNEVCNLLESFGKLSSW